MLYHVSALQKILAHYRKASRTEWEKGSYFEELIRTYLRHEPRFAVLCWDAWLFTDCSCEHGKPTKAKNNGKPSSNGSWSASQ